MFDDLGLGAGLDRHERDVERIDVHRRQGNLRPVAGNEFDPATAVGSGQRSTGTGEGVLIVVEREHGRARTLRDQCSRVRERPTPDSENPIGRVHVRHRHLPADDWTIELDEQLEQPRNRGEGLFEVGEGTLQHASFYTGVGRRCRRHGNLEFR